MSGEYDYDVIKRAGVSQGELAQLVGLSRITINKHIKAGTGPLSPNDDRILKEALRRLDSAVRLNVLPQKLPASRGNRKERLALLGQLLGLSATRDI